MVATLARMIRVCRCDHRRDAHEHHRRGLDCSLCECPRFRLSPARTVVYSLLAWLSGTRV